MPNEEQELICPNCKGAVDTVHPYYTATQHMLFLDSANPYTWWLLIGVLSVAYWPLGIVAYFIIYLYQVKATKNKKLYKCSKCNIKLSYNEASNAANNAT